MALVPAGGINSLDLKELDAALNLARQPLPNTPIPMLLTLCQNALRGQVTLICFGAIVEDRGSLVWQSVGCEKSQNPFPPLSMVDESQLQQLKPEEGWCLSQVEQGSVRWLVARTLPEEQGKLQLLQEVMAMRLSLLQAEARIESLTSPLRRNLPHWQEKLESFNRLLRLVDVLPSRQLYAQLDATLHYWMNSRELLLLQEEESEIQLLYPTTSQHSVELLQQLYHVREDTRFDIGHLHWYCYPITLYRQHQTTLAIASLTHLSEEDQHLLHTGALQLGLLLELEEHRLNKHKDHNNGLSKQKLQHKVRELCRINQRLQRELRQREEFERQLQLDSQKDPLTQLPNRGMFLYRLEHAFRHYQRYPEQGFAIMLLDLVSLRQINEQYSAQLGDLLLKNVAQLLQRCIRQNDMVARLSGDEFIFFLDASQSSDTITPIISRILNRLQEPVPLGSESLQLHANLGIATISPAIREVGELLRQADLAAFHAKQGGHDKAVFYSEQCETPDRLSPVQALAVALQEKRILPYFQPIRHLQAQHIVQVELLARWIDEQGTLREACDFIPLAEQSGLILDIDRLMLRHACGLLSGLFKPLLKQHPLRLAINLSGKHLGSREHIQQLLAIINEASVSPHCLTFEFRERELARRDTLALNLLHELRARGIGIAVDHFGTGCSSLNALFNYPVDYIKVDNTFTRRLLNTPRDKALVRAVRDISRDLGMEMIIEGVELAEQEVVLQEMGCTLAQGLFFDAPMQAEQIFNLLQEELNEIQPLG